MRKIRVLCAALTISSAAHATSIKEFWQNRPADAPHLQSGKSAGALEMCLGMDMSEMGGPPSVLHGDGEIVLTSMIMGAFSSSTPVYGFRILDHGTSREVVIGALQTGGWTNKAKELAERCL